MSETPTPVRDAPVEPDPPSVPVPDTTPSIHRPRARGARLLKYAAVALFIVAMLVVPLYFPPSWLDVGTWTMTGAVGAMGLTMLFGQAGQLSLAHTFFLLVGAVSYTVFASPTGDPVYVGFGLPPLLALLGAVVFTALVGALFAPVAGRLSGIYLGVASLSLVFLGGWLSRELPSLAGSTSSGRPVPTFELFGFKVEEPFPELTIGGVPIGSDERQWYLFCIITLVAYLLARGAIHGRTGRSWRAVRDNEAAATVLGVSVLRAKAGAFAVSSAYAGLAGVMTVWWFSLMKPDESEFGTYGTTVAISFLAMVVVGGAGSLVGAVLGGAIVFGLPLMIPLITQSGSGAVVSDDAFTPIVITNFIFGALIVLIILFEPRGLAGLGRRLVARFGRSAQSDSATAPTAPPEPPDNAVTPGKTERTDPNA